MLKSAENLGHCQTLFNTSTLFKFDGDGVLFFICTLRLGNILKEIHGFSKVHNMFTFLLNKNYRNNKY